MDASDRLRRTLRDILEFCAAAARIVQRGRAAYDDDELLRLASQAVLHKIGEAVSRLPDGFVQAHPEIPWRAMKGTRNIVAHRFEQIDYGIIWNALAHRLPEQARRIAVIARTV